MVKKLDERILQDYTALYSLVGDVGDVYTLPKARADAEFDVFDADRSGHVPNLHQDVELDKVNENIARALEVKAFADSLPMDSLKEAYRRRLEEDVASQRQIGAIATGDTVRYVDAEIQVVGAFNASLGRAALGYFSDWARSFKDGGTVSQQHIANAIMQSAAGSMNGERMVDLYPRDEVFERARQAHEPFYERILGGLALQDAVTYADRQLIIPQMTAALGAPKNMYAHVPRKEGVTTWSISHVGNGEIRDPRTDLSRDRFIGLIGGHEIGTHVSERVQAMQGPVGLLEFGLDGYIKAGEPKGVMREALVYPSIDEFKKTLRNKEIALRLALAAMPQLAPRTTFKEWFEFAENVHALQAMSTEPDLTVEEAQDQTKNKPRVSIKRAWRGGMMTESGVIVPKRDDEVYLGGLKTQFDLAANNPNYVEYADLGKFNLANPQHVEWLREWGVLPTAA